MKHILFLFLVMTFSSNIQTNSQTVLSLMPDSVKGWNQREADKLYTPETLYDYIDGGAELYLSYGMKDVASRIITLDNNEIRIEIFDMIEPRNAFGVFTHTRTHDEKQYGQGSQYFTGALIFWKDKYYISITANDENEAIVSTITTLAKSIESKITTLGEIPEILDLLPQQGLETDGYLYFHHYIWLNSYFYIANENLLNIRPETDALLAKYGTKNKRYFLLLIKYPDSESAEIANTAFRENFFKTNNKNNFEKMGDGSWLGAVVQNEYFIAVFHAGNKETTINLIKLVREKISKP